MDVISQPIVGVIAWTIPRALPTAALRKYYKIGFSEVVRDLFKVPKILGGAPACWCSSVEVSRYY